MPTFALPSFSPATHGFPFANSWEPGTPVIEVPTPFGTLNLGDASGGVCGGMVFAAIDFYLLNQPIPRDRTHSLFRYLCRRLLDSWSLPFGVMKYYDWQRRPGATQSWLGTPVVAGVTRLTVLEEWPKIRAAINAGMPAPLGLVKVQSWRPQDMSRNHQVLCHGYTEADDGSKTALHCYDPNWPGSEVRLTINLTSADEERWVEHSEEGFTIRGIFLTEYARSSVEWNHDA